MNQVLGNAFVAGGFQEFSFGEKICMPYHFQRLSDHSLKNNHCYKKKNLIFNPLAGCLFLAKQVSLEVESEAIFLSKGL